ncbi:MAG TPA: Grx4 family monothiol glutaredoxin, partial [Sorangium sp.]|nr:Grx4 family monothiol glutaredoxin [Sorangium sp.]
MSETHEQIQQLIDNHKVVLFMKGTRMFPQCGFSARSVEIFKRCGVTIKDVNVLADPAMRQGIKDFSNWPTIPQAYIDGKFVGGSDILLEMYENGELHQALGMDAPSETHDTPTVTLTAAAKTALGAALKDAGDDVLHLSISPEFEYDLFFGPKAEGAFEVQCDGIVVHVPKASASRADGASID